MPEIDHTLVPRFVPHIDAHHGVRPRGLVVGHDAPSPAHTFVGVHRFQGIDPVSIESGSITVGSWDVNYEIPGTVNDPRVLLHNLP